MKQGEDFRIGRRDTGEVWTNFPQLAIDHSPTGFEFGYHGSGPADLALNILETVLRLEAFKGHKVTVWKGRVYSLAYSLHQEFKREFIARLPREEGGTIPYKTVLDWINAHGDKLEEEE